MAKNQGWKENRDASGKAPKHRAAAIRDTLEQTMRTPMFKSPKINGMLVALDVTQGHLTLFRLDMEIRVRDGKLEFSASGDEGELMLESTFDKIKEDYWENADLEDEFGHMADEQGLKSPAKREEYLDGIKSQLQSEGDYPLERIEDYTINETYYIDTMSGCGQMLDSIKLNRVIPLIPKDDLKLILATWNKYHLKQIPTDAAAKIIQIIEDYNENSALDILGRAIKKSGASLNEWMGK